MKHPDLANLLLNPTGWREDIFGLVYPADDRGEVWVRPISGYEIRGDKVFRYMDGERVEQKGWDAIQARAMARSIFGEEIANLAGIEPE